MDGGESEGSIDERIEPILRLNGFKAESLFHDSSDNHPFFGAKYSGLWLIPSYINHTCVDANCSRYFVGDFMFVRAKKSIEKGEELLFPYVCPSDSFEERQRRCRSYGFDCQCRLCMVERQDPFEIKQEIEKLHEFMDDVNERNRRFRYTPDISTMKNIFEKVLQIRPQRDLNYLADQAQEPLSALIYDVDKNESLRMVMEKLESLKSKGEFVGTLTFLRVLRRTSWFKGEKVQEKWKMEAREIAKLIYGDERMADM